MVEPHEVQDRRVKIVNVNFVLDGFVSELVGGSVNRSAFHASAGHPHGEAVVVVVPPVDLAGVGALLRQLNRRRPTELTSPQNESVLEQTPLFEVADQSRDRHVTFPGESTMVDLDVVVAVPRLASSVPHLDVPHATLDKSPRDQNLPRLSSRSVRILNVLRFARDVERLGRFHLHSVGQLEGLDPRFQLLVVLPFLQVLSVELLKQIELSTLLGPTDSRVADILDQLLNLRGLRVDVSSLKDARQKSGLPVLRLLNRIAAGTHRDESRQVLILCPQSPGQPRADARSDQTRVAAVHQQERRLMIRHIRVHRPDDRHLVNMLSGVLENLADRNAAFAILLEFVRRRKEVARRTFCPQIAARQRLAGHFLELRFWIERVNVRWSTVHKEVDNVLRPWLEMRFLRQQRIAGLARFAGGQIRQRESSEPHAATGEHFASTWQKFWRERHRKRSLTLMKRARAKTRSRKK